MKQNDKFQFVVHKENFLSVSQCQKLMRYLETGEPTESELAGNYDNNILKVIYIFSKTGTYYLYLRKPPNKIIIDNTYNQFTINFFII